MVRPLRSLTQDDLTMRLSYSFTFCVFLCSVCLWPVSWISWVILVRESGMSCGILSYWNPLDQHTLAGPARVIWAGMTVAVYLSLDRLDVPSYDVFRIMFCKIVCKVFLSWFPCDENVFKVFGQESKNSSYLLCVIAVAWLYRSQF